MQNNNNKRTFLTKLKTEMSFPCVKKGSVQITCMFSGSIVLTLPRKREENSSRELRQS